jgi:hypothetical protein
MAFAMNLDVLVESRSIRVRADLRSWDTRDSNARWSPGREMPADMSRVVSNHVSPVTKDGR